MSTRTVTGVLKNIDGTPRVNAEIKFYLLESFVTGTEIFLKQKYLEITDSNGHFSISLGVPDSESESAKYMVEFPGFVKYTFELEPGDPITLQELISGEEYEGISESINVHRLYSISVGEEYIPGFWWLQENVDPSDCIVAFAPTGAISYAESKVNLANPGTYNAVEGEMPFWDTINGWKLDGIDMYMLIPSFTFSGIGTYILKYNNADWINSSNHLLGFHQNSTGMNIGINTGLDDGEASPYKIPEYNNQSDFMSNVLPTSGILTIINGSFYMNEVLFKTFIPNSFTNTQNFFLGAINDLSSGLHFCTKLNISSFAYYNKTITQSQVEAIRAAMP